jgi:hypothetical protein
VAVGARAGTGIVVLDAAKRQRGRSPAASGADAAAVDIGNVNSVNAVDTIARDRGRIDIVICRRASTCASRPAVLDEDAISVVAVNSKGASTCCRR